jgi:DNA-binding transcriptional regulator YiaG
MRSVAAGSMSGPAIRDLRRGLGVGAPDVAATLGVSVTRIYTLEAAAHLRASTAERLLGALREVAQERREAVRELYGEAS